MYVTLGFESRILRLNSYTEILQGTTTAKMILFLYPPDPSDSPLHIKQLPFALTSLTSAYSA